MSVLEQLHQQHKERRARLWSTPAPAPGPSLHRIVVVTPTQIPVRAPEPPPVAAEPPIPSVRIAPRCEAHINAAARAEAKAMLCRAVQAMRRAGWRDVRIARVLGTSLVTVNRYAALLPGGPEARL